MTLNVVNPRQRPGVAGNKPEQVWIYKLYLKCRPLNSPMETSLRPETNGQYIICGVCKRKKMALIFNGDPLKTAAHAN